MKRLVALVALVIALPLAACAAPSAGDANDDSPASSEDAVTEREPIKLTNWVSHPKIVQVRKVVQEIDAARAARRFKSARKENLCPDGIGEDYRVQVKDRSGKVRMLELASGSDDSYGTRTLYFDAKGKLRFVFDASSDVHQNAREQRIYFGDDGAPIWEVVRTSHDQEIASRPFQVVNGDEKLELDANEKTGKSFGLPPMCN